jgi:copper ion binding protein
MTKSVINVQGMSCGHCVKAVESAVKALPGIVSVDVDLKKQTAAVEFDESKTALEGIREAIREAGYDAE